jgi:hypothetical protein
MPLTRCHRLLGQALSTRNLMMADILLCSQVPESSSRV